MNLKFYDIETPKGWWCIVVGDNQQPVGDVLSKEAEAAFKSTLRVYHSDEPNVIERLKADMAKGVLSGYNIKRFDMIVLKGILMGMNPVRVHMLANLIIALSDKSGNKFYALQNEDPEYRRLAPYARGMWQGFEAIQDLMDDGVKGLKDLEAAYGMDIQEYEGDFTVEPGPDAKVAMIDYCKHDVYALFVHYWKTSKPYIDTKLSLAKTYDLSMKYAYQSTNAVLAGRVLGAERMSGTTIKDPTIKIHETELREYFEKWVPTDFLNHLLTSQQAYNATIFENRVYVGDGGLHSTFTTPKIGRITTRLHVESCEEYGLYNVDASSCYSAVMLFCNAMSRAITNPKRYMEIFLKRLGLKSKPKHEWTQEEKDFVAAAKLILNTTYGAMGNKYLPLYDDYMRSKVCRVGQLILIAIANRLFTSIPGLRVIQTNTDGILVYTKRTNLPAIQEMVAEFEKISKFTFEIEEDKAIWQNNVNNYIAIEANGNVKTKGEAFITSVMQPGYNRVRPLNLHVIAKAVIAFYTKGECPVMFLANHTEVRDFVLTATKGPGYGLGMWQFNQTGNVQLGRVSRVVATTTEKYGTIKKGKINTKGVEQWDTVSNCPPHTWIINDRLENYRMEGDIQKKYLIHENGDRAEIDMIYYVRQLSKDLETPWYSFKNGKLGPTQQFDLGGA